MRHDGRGEGGENSGASLFVGTGCGDGCPRGGGYLDYNGAGYGNWGGGGAFTGGGRGDSHGQGFGCDENGSCYEPWEAAQ